VLPERGNETNLYILGQQNGNSNNNGTPHSLQLNTGFTVPAGGNADFTIDFVLRKGLTKPVNSDYYLLRPALRLVNNVEVGTISGRVENAVIATNACSEASGTSIYLYEGDLNANEQVPDDIYDPNINANIDTVAENVGGQRPSLLLSYHRNSIINAKTRLPLLVNTPWQFPLARTKIFKIKIKPTLPNVRVGFIYSAASQLFANITL
jgi:hypothetical protein